MNVSFDIKGFILPDNLKDWHECKELSLHPQLELSKWLLLSLQSCSSDPICCFDPRVIPEDFLGLTKEDRAILVRTASGTPARNIMDIVAIDRLVGISELIVVKHTAFLTATDCGATYLTDEGVREHMVKHNPDLAGKINDVSVGATTDIVERTRQDVDIIKSSPFLRKELRENVSGLLFNIKTGKICHELWGLRNCLELCGENINTTALWNYYLKTSILSLHDGGRHVAVRTHRDVVDVAYMLKAGATRWEAKEALRTKLKKAHANEDELLENTIDLVASLVVMCDCGISSHGFSGSTEIEWKHGSLGDFLAKHFGGRPILAPEKIKFEQTFKARNFDRITGLEIIWTDNLVDHLRLTDDDTKVHIFHHASFLESQRWSTQSLLPANLAAETLQTLALLFPSTDRETRRWVSKLPRVDPRIAQCGRLKTDLRQIERFHIWRDRLVMLKQVFDEAQPKTLRHWWHDRRNGVQWYTFWVAVLVLILTVVFGVTQSIEGAIQAYASLKELSDHAEIKGQIDTAPGPELRLCDIEFVLPTGCAMSVLGLSPMVGAPGLGTR
ncbi:hypothetical protein RRF57_012079 [Xylaria bambusicola]|uniref:Uncharacterized protein n=1 Tax=Xylaria bambusicola TaxID=326684 RepID=A0AAN7ZAF0_9PEZI